MDEIQTLVEEFETKVGRLERELKGRGAWVELARDFPRDKRFAELAFGSEEVGSLSGRVVFDLELTRTAAGAGGGGRRSRGGSRGSRGSNVIGREERNGVDYEEIRPGGV